MWNLEFGIWNLETHFGVEQSQACNVWNAKNRSHPIGGFSFAVRDLEHSAVDGWFVLLDDKEAKTRCVNLYFPKVVLHLRTKAVLKIKRPFLITFTFMYCVLRGNYAWLVVVRVRIIQVFLY